MEELRQVFISGKMNKDTDERYLKNGEYTNAENVRVLSPIEGGVGVVKNLPSSVVVSSLNSIIASWGGEFFIGDINCLSFAIDEINKLIYLFLTTTGIDSIIEVDTNNNTAIEVVRDYNKSNSSAILNLGNKPFNRGKILDGYLFWTNNSYEPCKIDIDKFKNTTLQNLTKDDVLLIQKPPIDSPKVIPLYDKNILVNKLEKSILKFAYRYIYYDNSISSLSFFSETVYSPLFYPNGNMRVNRVSTVNLTIGTGGGNVDRIEVLGKDVNSSTMYIVKVLDKAKLGIGNNENYSFNISSYNEGAVLPEQETLKQFDNVPIKASEIEIADSRVFLADYVEGYNLERYNKKIQPSVTLSPIKSTISLNSFDIKQSETTGKINTYDFSTYIPKTSDTMVCNFDIEYTASSTYTSNRKSSLLFSILNDYNSFSEFYNSTEGGSFINLIIKTFKDDGADASVSIIGESLVISVFGDLKNSNGLSIGNINKISGTFSINTGNYAVSYRHTLPYRFGIVYYDDYNRSSSVLTFNDNEVTFDHQLNDLTNVNKYNIGVQIAHQPPEWATKFKIVRTAYEHRHNLFGNADIIFGSSSISYPMIVPSSDDVDKFNVGDIVDVYVQTDLVGTTITNPSNRVSFKIRNKIDLVDYSFSFKTDGVIGFSLENVSDVDYTIGMSTFNSVSGTEGASSVTLYKRIHGEVYSSPVAKQNFYETSQTFYCDNGYHIGGDTDQDASNSFFTILNDGDNIIDPIGRFHYKIDNKLTGNEFDSIDSLRVNNELSINGQQYRYGSITHSGKYIKENSLNDLNAFNISDGNFEDFDREKGRVVKLHVRESDLIVFQENAINRIMLNKSIIFSAEGTQTITSSKSVLGQKIQLPYKNGISNEPESFDSNDNIMFFSDSNRSSICMFDGNNLVNISDYGMSGWFNNVFKNGVEYVQGAYDRLNNEYLISIKPINGNVYTIGFNNNKQIMGWTSFYDLSPEKIINVNNKIYRANKTATNYELYEADADLVNRNNIENTLSPVTSKIDIVINETPDDVKIIKYIEIDSTNKLDLSISSDGKTTSIDNSEFIEKEGNFFAYMRRAENEDSDNGNNFIGLSNILSYDSLSREITLDKDIQCNISEQDSIYFLNSGVLNEIGNVVSFTNNTITLDGELNTPINGKLVVVVRNKRIEGSEIRGGVINTSITIPQNVSTNYVELSSIVLGINKSYS